MMINTAENKSYDHPGVSCLRLKFDDDSEKTVRELNVKIAHLYANCRFSVNIPKSFILIPKIESTLGLSYDRLYEVLRQLSTEFGSLYGKILDECEIRQDDANKSTIFLQLHVRQLSSLSGYLEEVFGLQNGVMSVSSELVYISVGSCFPGFEYQLPSMKLILDEFLRQVSSFINLSFDSLELTEQYPGTLSPLNSLADKTIFKLEGKKVKPRRSFVRLEGTEGAQYDEFSSPLGTIQVDSPFRDYDGNQQNRNLSNGKIFSFPVDETELSSSVVDLVGRIDNGIFSYPSNDPSGQYSHLSPPPGIASPSLHYNQQNSPKALYASNGAYQPGYLYPQSRPSPSKQNFQDGYLHEPREYHSQSIGSSNQNYTWSENGSDLQDAPYDIYRSDSTRQRQNSDPVTSRGRQYSDPGLSNGQRLGSYAPISSRKPINNISTATTPDRASNESMRPPLGNAYVPHYPQSNTYPYDGRGEIPNRERRSISESGALPDGEGTNQYLRSNPVNYSNRSVNSCPNCQILLKRNQTLCPRCRIPVSNVPQTNENWNTRSGYSPHPSESSFGSDYRSELRSEHSLSISSQHSYENGYLPNSMSPAMSNKGETIREGDWLCPYCNGHNFATKIACFTCHMARPGFERGIPANQMESLGIGRLGGSSAEAKPGDWTCPKCHENVFAKRNRCYRCTTSRPRKLSH